MSFLFSDSAMHSMAAVNSRAHHLAPIPKPGLFNSNLIVHQSPSPGESLPLF